MSKAKIYNPKQTDVSLIKKGFLLYLFLIPLFVSVVIALFHSNYKAFLLNTVAFILFFVVVALSKRGFAQERDYHLAKLTKAPKIPYKLFAAYLLGISVFLTAWIAGGKALFDALFIGVLAIVGYWLYYGFDPREDKLDNFGDISVDIVLETLHEAQSKVKAIEEDIKHINDKLLHAKITLALERANTILNAITEDPKDIRSARKFLVVYIDGIAKVTQSYIGIDESEITPETRAKLLTLMEEVEERFVKELKRLKANNQFDLDVHIDVLKEQIKY